MYPFGFFLAVIIAAFLTPALIFDLSGTFSGCTDLTIITIPDGVTSIGSGAFSGCTELSRITIPDSVTYLGASAFSCCQNLKQLTISKGLTNISDNEFYGCKSLKSVIIPEGVTSIGEWVFANCPQLETVNIPESVTSIADTAFIGCPKFAKTKTEYHAGIAFQTNSTWNIRESFNLSEDYSPVAMFPSRQAGIQGGMSIDSNYAAEDVTLSKDGDYTVSIPKKGTVTRSDDEYFGSFTVKYYLYDENGKKKRDENTGKLIYGTATVFSPWSILNNYVPMISGEYIEEDTILDSKEQIDQIEWTPATTTDKFNMLQLTTDIPCVYNDAGKPLVNGKEIGFTDIKVDFGDGQVFTPKDSEIKFGDTYGNQDYVTLDIINVYAESSIDKAALPKNDDGNITISFHISGLDAALSGDANVAIKASASLKKADRDDLSDVNADMTILGSDGMQVANASADGNGEINLRDLKAGKYTAVFAAEGFAPRKISVTVSDGKPVELGEIELCKYGDVTGDGDVNMRDLARIQQKLSKWDVDYVYDETADVTGDGEVNMRDLARLQQWLSKWEVVLGK